MTPHDPPRPHGPDDHVDRDTGLRAADRIAADRGLRLTPVRRQVLGYLLESRRAMGAYAVLDRLRADGLGSQPPVAYRALDFLVSNGFAHRIEGLNAFTACSHVGDSHAPIFLICQSCNAVEEAETDPAAGEIGRAARTSGFRVDRAVREAIGLCPDCAAEAG